MGTRYGTCVSPEYGPLGDQFFVTASLSQKHRGNVCAQILKKLKQTNFNYYIIKFVFATLLNN